jgi:hypothetical protein
MSENQQGSAIAPQPTALDSVKAWLAALLRGAEPGPIPDEAVLLDTARAEGVLALCRDRLRRSPAWAQYPGTLRAALTRDAYQEVAVEMMRATELREVLEALARQGLPVLLLKGAALAYTLYPEPHLRSRCDTDLLLPSREEAERAWRVMQTLGYNWPGTMHGDLISYELVCDKTSHGGLSHALDVHWRWSNAALFAERFTFTELAAAAMPVLALGPSARGLGLAHTLLLACVHRFVNLGMGIADRLIWLYDIHLLAQHLNDELWRTFTTLAEERALCGPCLDGVDNARALLATPLPDEILSRLRAGAEREGFDPCQFRPRWRYEWQTFRALPSTAMRLRRLGQLLFPNVGHMRDRYGFRHSLWLPWFYGVRIVQGIAKQIWQGH